MGKWAFTPDRNSTHNTTDGSYNITQLLILSSEEIVDEVRMCEIHYLNNTPVENLTDCSW